MRPVEVKAVIRAGFELCQFGLQAAILTATPTNAGHLFGVHHFAGSVGPLFAGAQCCLISVVSAVTIKGPSAMNAVRTDGKSIVAGLPFGLVDQTVCTYLYSTLVPTTGIGFILLNDIWQ